MEAWTPFRSKPVQPPRTRGRRRQRPSAAADGPDQVLTDLDAAHAAEQAVQARSKPVAPAWDRHSSGLAEHSDQQHLLDDGILKLGQAACGPGEPPSAADTGERRRQLRQGGPKPDYGTGQAYDPASMR